jgi:TatD DNase family protein
MHELIDSHCHLDFEAFDADRDRVIQRARSCGISHIVIPGVRRSTWSTIRAICETDAQIHPCYGLHPYLAAEHADDDLDNLARWLAANECVAIGECGLDYRKGQADKQVQMQFFEAQVEMAFAGGNPVVIHSVRATEDVIRTVSRYPGLRGMIHSFSGSYEQAMTLVDLGFYISFGGAVTHDRATKLRATAARLPLNAILIETDAPDQPDAAHPDQRNEPSYLVNVLDCLQTLRDEPVERIAEQTTLNAKELYRI